MKPSENPLRKELIIAGRIGTFSLDIWFIQTKASKAVQIMLLRWA